MASLFAAKSANGAFRAVRPQARRHITVQRNLLRGAVILAATADKEQVLATVQKIICEQLSLEADKVNPESKFADLDADSLDTVEIMMALEDEFQVNLDENTAGEIATVAGAADALVKAIEEKTEDA